MLLMTACAGCPRSDPAASTSPVSSDASAALAPIEKSVSNDAGSIDNVPWPSAIAAERWAEAEAIISALPPAERAKPEVRLARARVARMLGKEAFAITLLDKLEDALPLLRDLIAKERALSQIAAGPADEAAEWFAAQPVPSMWLLAAEAWDRAGDTARARVQCDRVVGAPNRTRTQEEAARALRMRIVRDARTSGRNDGGADESTLATDAKWLAVHALDSSRATTAEDVLAHFAPGVTLSPDDLLTRARMLGEAGRTDEALRTVERATSAKDAKGNLSEIDRCRARAEIEYKSRTRYTEAALAYRACARLGGPHAAEDAFLSARAFSRADRDADALAAFASVIRQHPKTTWADQAAFHIARTHALAGRWREAARAFDGYAEEWPRGREKREADRYRALSHLMAQDHKIARKLLEDLAGSGDDPIARARWTNLATLAALRDGDRLHALSRWTEVARAHPLTWPALVARAHLVAESTPVPPVIDPLPAMSAPPTPFDVVLPPPVDVLHRIGLDADAEQALRERESAVIGKAQGPSTEALCRAYAELDRAKRRYQLSLKVPPTLLATAPGPNSRWAWDCAFPRPYERHVENAAETAHVDTNFLWAVMRQESAFDPDAVSPARAVGLLQLMPATAKVLATAAGLPHEEGWLVRPGHNVLLGARYLRELLDKFAGNETLAAAAYNAGADAIVRWQNHAKGETLDVFVEMIPFLETRGYVVRVMSNLARYGFLERGEAGVPRIALSMK
ncbi:MAG: lytic transglycosylase domain-containing protein [Polyangiaceae bacterium]|nr:lytic transglycosylase domain-containing protein [Polyangiaceae bacterium]